MYEEMFSERLIKLRMAHNVSARGMSLSMGQSPNYIYNLENKIALPSMTAFFYICDYFKITPKEYFDVEVTHPAKFREAIEDLKDLDDAQLTNVAAIIKGLKKRK